MKPQSLWEGAEPRPQGKTPLERPTLTWQMRPKSGQLRRIQMRINGMPIPTRYDETTQTIIGEPQEPVPLGKLKAVCEVWLTTDRGVDIEWEFTRVPKPPPPPPPDRAQHEALAQLNQMRRTGLLPDMTLEPALCLAAARHSRYLTTNRQELSHDQEPGHPEFFGKDPEARAERAGFFEPCYEVLAQAPQTNQSLQNLLDAPYHRAALLQPGAVPAGVGIAGDRVTVLCALSALSETVIWPADGQLEVSPQWLDTETPDPLRVHPGANKTTGYPITLHVYGVREAPTLIEASLRGPSGQPVACYTNTPENDDELDDMILLIPQQPLEPQTRYQARIVVRDPDGRQIARSWQFTTGRAPEPPRPLPPKPILPPKPKPVPKPPLKKKK